VSVARTTDRRANARVRASDLGGGGTRRLAALRSLRSRWEARGGFPRRVMMSTIGKVEGLVHCGVTVVLLGVAVVVLCHAATALVMTKQPFAQSTAAAVNGALFAMIIVEVTSTVTAYFHKRGLQLERFLTVGSRHRDSGGRQVAAPSAADRVGLDRRTP
jgi:hypothetical protein